MTKIILKLIKIYQNFFSFDTGLFRFFKSTGTCRFFPSCSEYFYSAVKKYGPLKGSIKGVKRIFKCHPFSLGGYDPLI